MTRTVTETFTLTNAKYIASKVTADMRRCQQIYGEPSDSEINNYGTELSLLLRDGYVEAYEFGYVRDSDNERILTWRYTVDASGNLTADDRPGRIIANVNITGASMHNMLERSNKWFALTEEARDSVNSSLPIQRVTSKGYGSKLGFWQNDLQYASGGVAISRRTFKPFGT